MFYAAHNSHADLYNGNHGFANTWEVSRFKTRQERDAFVEKMSNHKARAVTRKRAAEIWEGCFLCVGDKVPVGGLFGVAKEQSGPWSPFWNEYASQWEEVR